MEKNKRNKKGLTLIELILSIALLGMIITAFMSLFVLSSKTNSKSELLLESTYIGKDAMELAYKLSQEASGSSLESLEDVLQEEAYKRVVANEYERTYEDGRYLRINFSKENDLVRVVSKVYKDKSMEDLETKYESLYFWQERAIK